MFQIKVDNDENALLVEDNDEEEYAKEFLVQISSDEKDENNKIHPKEDEEDHNEEDVDEHDEEDVDEHDQEDVDDHDEEDVDDHDEENVNDHDEEDNEYENNTECVEKSQRKSRIIKAFDDTDEEEGANDDMDFLKTQPPTTQLPLLDTQAPVKTSPEDDENELIALCSGTFDATQKTAANALMSQIPITQNSGKSVNDEELIELCSGTFDQPDGTQQSTQKNKVFENVMMKCNKILSSDEENERLDKNEQNKKRVRKLTKKLKKRKAKLGFSDDEDEKEEDEDEECNKHGEEIVDVDLDNTSEEPETFVDYDSEENEILVQMTNKDRVKQAQNFFENEAELSESEWGSADEDEKNLDNYDIELGDEDEFDREKLQTELGKIHA